MKHLVYEMSKSSTKRPESKVMSSNALLRLSNIREPKVISCTSIFDKEKKHTLPSEELEVADYFSFDQQID